MVSVFGESSDDQRDYGFAFAAFKGSLYLATVMAARGTLSKGDAEGFKEQMMHGIEIVPQEHMSPAARQVIVDSLDSIIRLAAFQPEAGAVNG